MHSSILLLLTSAKASTISLDIERKEITGPRSQGDNVFSRSSSNFFQNAFLPGPPISQYYGYFVSLHVGSNKEYIEPMLDTQSSDFWVMSNWNPFCFTTDCDDQIFNTFESYSFHRTWKSWSSWYSDRTWATGFYGSDDIYLGNGLSVNTQFGIANLATSQDVLGLGFSTASKASLPETIKAKGLIKKNAFSFFLNSAGSSDGQILLGAVNHAKYSGSLGLLPILETTRSYNSQPAFRVMLNGLSTVKDSVICGVSSFALPFLLDSTTSYAILPQQLVTFITDRLGYQQNGEFYSGKCDGFDFDSFELNFMGIKLKVAPESLLVPQLDWTGSQVEEDGSNQCYLAIQTSQSESEFVLGDIFLRNFYVVYDLDGREVAIAQANFNANNDIEEIVDQIPRAISAPSYHSTKAGFSFPAHKQPTCQTSSISSSSSRSKALPTSQTTLARSSSLAEPHPSRSVIQSPSSVYFSSLSDSSSSATGSAYSPIVDKSYTPSASHSSVHGSSSSFFAPTHSTISSSLLSPGSSLKAASVARSGAGSIHLESSEPSLPTKSTRSGKLSSNQPYTSQEIKTGKPSSELSRRSVKPESTRRSEGLKPSGLQGSNKSSYSSKLRPTSSRLTGSAKPSVSEGKPSGLQKSSKSSYSSKLRSTSSRLTGSAKPSVSEGKPSGPQKSSKSSYSSKLRSTSSLCTGSAKLSTSQSAISKLSSKPTTKRVTSSSLQPSVVSSSAFNTGYSSALSSSHRVPASRFSSVSYYPNVTINALPHKGSYTVAI